MFSYIVSEQQLELDKFYQYPYSHVPSSTYLPAKVRSLLGHAHAHHVDAIEGVSEAYRAWWNVIDQARGMNVLERAGSGISDQRLAFMVNWYCTETYKDSWLMSYTFEEAEIRYGFLR